MKFKLFSQRPWVYALTYLALIPIYALIYLNIPCFLDHKTEIVDSLYFSVVTLTTLGYGDILPNSTLTKGLAASESLLGVVFVGMFLNSISHVVSESSRNNQVKIEEKRVKNEVIHKIRSNFILLTPAIQNYRNAAIRITSLMSDQPSVYNPDFTFNSMKDLYGPSLSMTHDSSKPAVYYFYKYEEILNEGFSALVRNVDLKKFKAIEDKCLAFCNMADLLDFKDGVLSVTQAKTDKGPLKELYKDMIESADADLDFRPGNAMNMYVALRKQIQLQMHSLEEIERLHNEILASSDEV